MKVDKSTYVACCFPQNCIRRYCNILELFESFKKTVEEKFVIKNLKKIAFALSKNSNGHNFLMSLKRTFNRVSTIIIV